MTRVFFTADCHFDHNAIIRFCDRPFENERHMNEELVDRWCRKVGTNDLVYHLGDFAFKGESNAKFWETKLTGDIVHIRGNHDKNNGVKTIITHAIMEYGGLIIYATHRPPDEFQEGTIEANLITACDIILCGHVHGLWKWKKILGKICINVGVDVWDYEPVNIASILKLVAKINRGDKC